MKVGTAILIIAILVAMIASSNAVEVQILFKTRCEITPDSASVPANHLKFYLQFATPMERGEVFRYFRLIEVDPEGKEIAEVPEPFREVELWDESFTRMTLWLHPGRQKPGVNLNVELGPILEEGREYVLEISGKWKNEMGQELGLPIRHQFKTHAADNTQPVPEKWRLDTTSGPVKFHLREQLDPISAQSSFKLRHAKDHSPVPTKLILPTFESISEEGTLKILPDSGLDPTATTFPPGDYELVIDPKLEDLAGNSIARPFNLNLEKKPDFKERKEPVILPFTIPKPPK